MLLSAQLVKLQAILFDIDGTLTDSNDIHCHCWVEAFAHFGKEVPWDEMRMQMGKGGDLLVPDLLDAREMRKFGDDLRQYRGELFKKKYMKTIQVFPGATESLEELRSLGIKLALASSSNEDEVEYYTQLLGVEDLIVGTTSKGDAEFSKPFPEIFLAALKKTKCDPVYTMTAGDTPYDVRASHRIALPIAAVLSGGFPRDTLSKAEFLFEDVNELTRRIGEVDAYFNAND
jgi:beta-phosphoglucomutase-like phosphatase (HAD superfamily)